MTVPATTMYRLAISLGRASATMRPDIASVELGCELVEKRELKRFQARTYKDFGAHVIPWTRHVRTGRKILRSALEIANQSGDLTFAAYSYVSLNSNFLAAGDPLIDVQRQVEIGLAFAEKVRFQFVMDLARAQLGLVRTLRGQTRQFGSFDDYEFDELEVERRYCRQSEFGSCGNLLLGPTSSRPASLRATTMRPSMRHRGRAGCHGRRWRISRKRRNIISTAPCPGPPAAGHAAPDQRMRHLEALAGHHRQLQIYAENCPENFENRAALVGAEIARLEGREIDAERLYELAIRSARANGFIHHVALAYELAARFYAARGFEEIARLYLGNARDGYLRWGADAKVRQLDETYPYLRDRKPLRRFGRHDRDGRRTPRPRDRDQGVASHLQRNRPG